MPAKPKVVLSLTATIVVAITAVAVWITRDDLGNWLRVIWRFENIGRNEQGVVVYRHRASGLRMALVSGPELERGRVRRSSAQFCDPWDHFELTPSSGDMELDDTLLEKRFLVSLDGERTLT